MRSYQTIMFADRVARRPDLTRASAILQPVAYNFFTREEEPSMRQRWPGLSMGSDDRDRGALARRGTRVGTNAGVQACSQHDQGMDGSQNAVGRPRHRGGMDER